MAIKAINTEYNGYKFRSRLEARWAVFFDTLGIEYEYEPEGFEFEDGTRYLPDFWMPTEECFIEIKPGTQWHYHKKSHLLFSGTNKRVVYIAGLPWPGEYRVSFYTHLAPFHDAAMFAVGQKNNSEIWIVSINGDWGQVLKSKTSGSDFCRPIIDADILTKAYTAARQARFEFGETPKI